MTKKFSIFNALLFFIVFLLCIPAHAQVKKKVTYKKSTVKKATAKKPADKAPQIMETAFYPGPVRIKLVTDSGTMIIRLSDSTPIHRDNFAKLVKEGFYDSLIFHRVIRNFMIQGGDPTSKYAAPGSQLGNGGDSMKRLPAEFRTSLFHKKGVLAAARDGNAEKASSACQFYIVEGKVLSDAELDVAEKRSGKIFSAQERLVYKTIGGTPWLDNNYTVFGEVESGMEVISKISHAAKDGNNRPLQDIRMHAEIIK